MLKAIRDAALAAAVVLVPAAAGAESVGFGTDIPLEMAVRQIVPQGVKVVIEDGVDAGAKVSWPEGTSWKKSVASAAGSGGYVTSVTDDTVRVMKAGAVVDRAPDRSPSPPASGKVASKAKASSAIRAPREDRREASRPRPRRAEEASVAVRRSERRERPASETVSGGGFVLIPEGEKVASAAPRGEGWRDYPAPRREAPAPAPAAKWVAMPGDDLHALLADWSDKAGWRLVWNSGNRYSLTSAARFDGDFVQAVTQLLASMKDVRPVVTAQFYQGNTTLVVGNDSLDAAN